MAAISNLHFLTKNEQLSIQRQETTMCHYCEFSTVFQVLNPDTGEFDTQMLVCNIGQEIKGLIVDCSSFERDKRLE